MFTLDLFGGDKMRGFFLLEVKPANLKCSVTGAVKTLEKKLSRYFKMILLSVSVGFF